MESLEERKDASQKNFAYSPAGAKGKNMRGIKKEKKNKRKRETSQTFFVYSITLSISISYDLIFLKIPLEPIISPSFDHSRNFDLSIVLFGSFAIPSSFDRCVKLRRGKRIRDFEESGKIEDEFDIKKKKINNI